MFGVFRPQKRRASHTSCGHRGLRVVGQDTRAVFVCSIEVGPDGMPPSQVTRRGSTPGTHEAPSLILWDFWGFNMIEPGKIWGDNSNSGSVSIRST